ncbi:MAG TPA: PEP-CTERM sorting domain-containing protein [Sedimentisphaerales bacterium]|nr:PEP-CTERM sorting domain-containing protein [Sedimentisphaerales bacterium]HNU30508.1 PEP-CTERM sorting domain-containing protein [Sedimentisphaerales bacterium]
MCTRMFWGALAICLLAGSTAAGTVIDYVLDGGWTYEEGYPGTLWLEENPSGGIIANVDQPVGIEDGGLVASRHALPGYSLSDAGFIQLEYSSLSSVVTDEAGLGLVLELEFYDASLLQYEMAMGIWLTEEGTEFETWFDTDMGGFDYYIEIPAPDGLSFSGGALGLYSDGSQVLPYFKDAAGSTFYPFPAWDISGLVGTHSYSVDNDFEAETIDGGTAAGSVNLKRVVYGPPVPEPASLALLGTGLAWLLGARRRIRQTRGSAWNSVEGGTDPATTGS